MRLRACPCWPPGALLAACSQMCLPEAMLARNVLIFCVTLLYWGADNRPGTPWGSGVVL